MTFRLSKDKRSWFKGISKEFKVQLDMYYLCLMMGIAANHKSDDPEVGDLIDYWADKYSKNKAFFDYLNLNPNTSILSAYFENYRNYLKKNTLNSLLKGVIKTNF